MLFTSKLTPEQWTEARRLRAEGASLAALGEQFGVHPDTIRTRAKKEAWPSLTLPAAVPAPPRRPPARTAARPRQTPAATAVIKRSLVPRLFNVIDIQLKLTELRMQQNLKAAETAIAKGEPLPAIEDGEKEMRHVSAAVKTIQQVTEINPELSKHVRGGALSTSAAASASEADAFRREIAQRIEKLVPPA